MEPKLTLKIQLLHKTNHHQVTIILKMVDGIQSQRSQKLPMLLKLTNGMPTVQLVLQLPSVKVDGEAVLELLLVMEFLNVEINQNHHKETVNQMLM